MGRDLMKEPLTPLELGLFQEALLEQVQAEFESKSGGLVTEIE